MRMHNQDAPCTWSLKKFPGKHCSNLFCLSFPRFSGGTRVTPSLGSARPQQKQLQKYKRCLSSKNKPKKGSAMDIVKAAVGFTGRMAVIGGGRSSTWVAFTAVVRVHRVPDGWGCLSGGVHAGPSHTRFLPAVRHHARHNPASSSRHGA